MSAAPVTLPISNIVNVTVLVSPQAPPTPTFNQGLIVGSSTVISAAERVRQYNSLAQMEQDGFNSSMPEHAEAALYFGQSPPPQILWVGRQDLTASETPLAALQACRAANFQWWACTVAAATKADHEAIANWAQSALPPVMYFFTTSDSDVPIGSAGNVFLDLKALNYNRVFGMYSTDQTGSFPNNAYEAGGRMGVEMGLNTGLANSFFTPKFKRITGVAVEPLTLTEVGNVEAANGNLYLSYGNAYTLFEQGKLPSGQFFDEVLNLDMLSSDIQYSVMNLLVDNPAIPQTDAGQTQLIHAVNQACERAKVRGFIAPGTWEGATAVLKLQPGDPMPSGYIVQSEPYRNQSTADRQARKAMPIYVAINEAGAVHSVTIAVFVQR